MMSSQTSWVAVAFMNREVELEQKKELAKNDIEAQPIVQNKPFFIRLRDKVIELFLQNQEYIHIELAFTCETTETEGECIAYGAFSKIGLASKIRKFTNPSYEWVYLRVTKLEMEKIKTFCETRISFARSIDDRIYDETSVFMSQIWPLYRNHKYWCVSFVIKALQEIGMFKYFSSETFTVDEAVHYLRNHERTIIGIPPRILKEHKAKVLNPKATNHETPYYSSLFE
jgi:hypothetical protein